MKNGLPTVITAMEDTTCRQGRHSFRRPDLANQRHFQPKNGSSDAINVLRGPAGAKVTLNAAAACNEEIKEYTLQRAEIKIQSVKGRDCSSGPDWSVQDRFIPTVQFNDPQPRNYQGIEDLQKQGKCKRSSSIFEQPRGIIEQRGGCLRSILPPNTKVVSTQGRVASQQHDYSTSVVKKERPTFRWCYSSMKQRQAARRSSQVLSRIASEPC